MFCPFVSIESREQLLQHRVWTAAPVWGATATLAPSGHSHSVITGRVQQLHQHQMWTAAAVWGATAAPASPSTHKAPPKHLELRKHTCNQIKAVNDNLTWTVPKVHPGSVCRGLLGLPFFSESYSILLQLTAGFLLPFSFAVEIL